MFDIKWIRDNPDAFDAGLARRGIVAHAGEVLALDERRREATARAQEIQTRRNKSSKEIGAAKARGEDADALIAQVGADKEDEAVAEADANRYEEALNVLLSGQPNLPADDVPDGADEDDNLELRRVGDPPAFDFDARDHIAIGEALGMMDFERAARMSGARFAVLSGDLARLSRALGAFMLDLHTTEFGYREIAPPVLVRAPALFGTGQLPKFGEDLFRTGEDLWMIPTAEVPLTNLVADEIRAESELPLRFTALTPCFRAEAGAAGKDTRGMIRQHQFDKVELVSIVAPEGAAAEHDRMTACAEEVLKRLELPYRVVSLCTGDLGFSARKTHDIEVWLPGQGRYREISSCSMCGDFQARRMKARYRPAEGKGTRFPHTLNGSALAVGRTLIAVLENGQRADGSVLLPTALRPYMGGIESLSPDV